MESRFDSQLKKGVLEMLVLGLLCRRQTYGYQLLGSIRQQSGGYMQLKEGTLYPILYRLEDEGLICSQWSAQGRAAPKKVYTATEAGQAEWHRRQTVWREFCSCVDGFFKEEEP